MVPDVTSVPTVPSNTPSAAIAVVVVSDSADSAEAVTRAMTISEAYSAGPNSSPVLASTGEKKAMIITATQPAKNERQRGNAQCRPGAALARHGVAVDADHHRGRLARHVQHDRRWWSRHGARRSRCRTA